MYAYKRIHRLHPPFRDVDIQPRQLAADPFSPPQLIFSRQALDERARRVAQAQRGFRPTRFGPPKHAKGLAMSAQEGIRLDVMQDGLPIRNPTRQEQQRPPIASGQAWSFHLAVPHNQRLTPQSVFREQFRATAWEVSQYASHEVGPNGRRYAVDHVVRGTRLLRPQVLGEV